MPDWFTRNVFAISLLLFSSAGLFGGVQLSSADLKGIVTDSSKAVIQGAAVSLRSITTNARRAATTDGTGAYAFFLLPPDEYEIEVSMPQFAPQIRRGITLTVGQTANLNFELLPATVLTELVVTEADLPLLEAERTHPAATLTQREIENLPINGRNFLSFTLLTSGVVEENAAITNTLLPQLPTSRLIFAGQNGRSNSVTIDGVDNNDIAGNGVRPTLSQEAVQEFQINHHTYNAEYGHSSGGSINIVSRSGANQLRGNAYDYFRHEKLDALNTFAAGLPYRPPFKRNQPGFTSGGPLRRDRTFFFAAYEGLIRRESSFTSILSDPSVLQPTSDQRDLIQTLGNSSLPGAAQQGATLQSLLTTSAGSPIYRLLTAARGAFPLRQTTNTGSLRVDHSVNAADRLFFRYNITNDSQHGVGVGGLTAPSAGFDIAVRDHDFVFGENHVSGKTVNEMRFQFVREVFNVDTVDPYGPSILVPGIGNFGRPLVDPSDRTQHRYQILDNFSYLRGRHYFKMGLEFNRYRFDTLSPVFMGGEIDFSRLPIPVGGVLGPNAAALVTALGTPVSSGGLGRPDLIPVVTTEPLTIVQQASLGFPVLFNQGFGDPNAVLAGKVLSGYWQDSMKLSTSLHVDAGVRYDYEMQPEGVHRDATNIAPRLGFSYTPSADSKFIFRGGAGIYVQPLYTATAFSAKILGKNQQISNILVSASPDLTPVAPQSVCGVILSQAGVPPSFCFYQQLISSGLLTFPNTSTIPASAYLNFTGLTRETSTNKLTVRLEDNARDTYTIQSSFGAERSLGNDWKVGADYLFSHGLRLIRIRNVNALPNPAMLDAFGRPTLTRRANPSLLADFVVETAGSSLYHGVTMNLTKRFDRHYQINVAYTLGKTIDDAIDIDIPEGPQDPTNTRAERSLSVFDARHRLSISAIIESPFKSRLLSGFKIAPIVTGRSAFPFNITTGTDINGDTVINDRPLGVGRNTGRGGNYFASDLRIARRFAISDKTSMELIADGFNIFNRVNFKEVNGSTGGALTLQELGFSSARVQARGDISPNQFGAFTSAYDARVIQLAVKVNF